MDKLQYQIEPKTVVKITFSNVQQAGKQIRIT